MHHGAVPEPPRKTGPARDGAIAGRVPRHSRRRRRALQGTQRLARGGGRHQADVGKNCRCCMARAGPPAGSSKRRVTCRQGKKRLQAHLLVRSPSSSLGIAGMAGERCPRPRPSPTLARVVPVALRPCPALPPAGIAAIRCPCFARAAAFWARSSAVEHYLDMVGVTGSIPVAPTISGRLRDTGL